MNIDSLWRWTLKDSTNFKTKEIPLNHPLGPQGVCGRRILMTTDFTQISHKFPLVKIRKVTRRRPLVHVWESSVSFSSIKIKVCAAVWEYVKRWINCREVQNIYFNLLKIMLGFFIVFDQ